MKLRLLDRPPRYERRRQSRAPVIYALISLYLAAFPMLPAIAKRPQVLAKKNDTGSLKTNQNGKSRNEPEPRRIMLANPDYKPESTDEIIVTANKQDQPLQSVPSSIWVGTQALLERNQVRDFDDLARIVPSLTISKTTQPANNSINIRGIGTYAFSVATKSSVTVVVDDVPQAFQAQSFKSLQDIEQIEVLRGPQSSLFGASSSAGAVLITTAQPTDHPSSGARFFLTADREQRLSAYISGPINERLHIRLAGGVSHYAGNLRNSFDERWILGHKDITVRGKIVWQPNNSMKFTAAGSWEKIASSCCTTAFYYVSPNLTFGKFQGVSIARDVILNGITPSSDNRRVSMDVDPQANARQVSVSLKSEWTVANHRVTSITAYSRYKLYDLQDTDTTAFNWGPGGANVPGAVLGGSANGGYFDVRSQTQEIKLTSPNNYIFQYLVGFFYSRSTYYRSFVRGSNSLLTEGNLLVVPPTNTLYSAYEARSSNKNYAIFGQINYKPDLKISIIAGFRLNRDLIQYRLTDRFHAVTYGSPACSTVTPSGVRAPTCDSRNSISGKAAITYAPAKNWMIFAAYDRGFKGAAFDLSSTLTIRSAVTARGPDQGFPVADVVASRQPIAPETVASFQIGFRSTIADHVTFNVTLFDERFRHFQAQIRDQFTLQNILNSVPRVSTRGVEFEIFGHIRQRLTLNASGAYDQATINEFPDAPCFPSQTSALGCVAGKQDLSGSSLPNAPKWNLSISGQYEVPLSSTYTAELRASWHWQSKTHFSMLMDPDSLQPAYGLLNVGVGIVRDHWRMSLFCNNLFDQSYASNKGRDSNWNINPYGASPGPISNAIKWTPGRESARYFGLELAATF